MLTAIELRESANKGREARLMVLAVEQIFMPPFESFLLEDLGSCLEGKFDGRLNQRLFGCQHWADISRGSSF
jgi:hypothetical protein